MRQPDPNRRPAGLARSTLLRGATVFCTAVAVFILSASAAPAAVLPVTDGLLLRLDGSDVTLGGGGVSSWNNQATGAGASADFTQGNSARRPDLVADAVNGQPALDFSGSGDFLNNAADSAWNSSTGHWTFFIVSNPDTASGTPNLLRSGYDDIDPGATVRPNDAAWGSHLSSNDYSTHGRKTSGSYVGVGSSGDFATDDDWHVQAGLIQALVDPSVQAWIDGVSVGSQVSDTTTAMTGHRRTNIGSNASSSTSPGELFDGKMAEVLVYREALSAGDRVSVQDYLYEKYLMPSQPGRDLPLAGNLRLHATLDAGDVSGTTNGSTVYDTAGTAVPRDGTVQGTVGNPAGVLDGALSFSGSDGNYVDFGNVLNPDTHSYTVSLWFNDDSMSDNQFLAGKDNSYSGDPGWSIWLAGSTLHLRGKHDGSTGPKFEISESGITPDEWHHVVMVLDRNDDTIYGYLDGAVFGSGDLDPNLGISNSRSIYLGRRWVGGASYSGLIDDFAIWDRALSSDEVGYLYTKGLTGFNAATVPEPCSWVLMTLGLLGLLGLRRRRTNRQ